MRITKFRRAFCCCFIYQTKNHKIIPFPADTKLILNLKANAKSMWHVSNVQFNKKPEDIVTAGPFI